MDHLIWVKLPVLTLYLTPSMFIQALLIVDMEQTDFSHKNAIILKLHSGILKILISQIVTNKERNEFYFYNP